MPTAAATTYSNKKLEPALPNPVVMLPVKLKASTSYTRGMLLGELTATPGTFAPYVHANTDGSQTPAAVMPYDAQTDSSGNITLSATSNQSGMEQGQTYPNVDVYIKGYFRAEDLAQSGAGSIDSNAVASGTQVLLKQGAITSGLVEIL